ncbi:hypothetical protein WKW79_09885 [Variovorax robiniae]|uniref:Uncharacterized protein n=1 Tax=Variovorax robiniae TaxID=1836199 RepID=A0ABU8X515_9BURK
MTPASSPQSPLIRSLRRLAAGGTLLLAGLVLGGCAVGAGIGVPIVPGVSLNLGVGPGGPVIGVSTGWGPLGAGVSLNHLGQVFASAGAGVGVGAGGAGVGIGVGKSVLLHDPRTVPVNGPVIGTAALGSPGNPIAP